MCVCVLGFVLFWSQLLVLASAAYSVQIWFLICFCGFVRRRVNELMESKGGKKKSSSSKSLFYEAPLGYSIEDIRPAGGIKKFRSAAYSNVSCMLLDVHNS